MTKRQAFLIRYPWPRSRPNLREDLQGWFGDGHREVLRRFLNADTKLVVELGCWKGLSTRFLAEAAPNATVFAVDTWEGSAEHLDNPKWAATLSHLYDQFVRNLWVYKDRVVMFRGFSEAGLVAIHAAGLPETLYDEAGQFVPDLVYVDASHEEQDVYCDVSLAATLFPSAVLVGDDYSRDWPGVVKSVDRFAKESGRRLEIGSDIVWILHP